MRPAKSVVAAMHIVTPPQALGKQVVKVRSCNHVIILDLHSHHANPKIGFPSPKDNGGWCLKEDHTNEDNRETPTILHRRQSKILFKTTQLGIRNIRPSSQYVRQQYIIGILWMGKARLTCLYY